MFEFPALGPAGGKFQRRENLVAAVNAAIQQAAIDPVATADVDPTVTEFVADGSGGPFTLDADALSTPGMNHVYVDGVFVSPAAYTVTDDEITFATGEEPSNGADVVVVAYGAFVGVAESILNTFASVSTFDAPVYVERLQVLGRDALGDGGACVLVRRGAEPDFGGVQSADGAWWEISPDPCGIAAYGPGTDGNLVVNIPSHFGTLQEAFDGTAHIVVHPGDQIVLNIETGHELTAGARLDDGEFGHYRIVAEDEVVELDPYFEGVSNSDFDSAVIFQSTDNLIVGNNSRMPTLACLIDMASPHDESRLGNGIHIVNSTMTIESGCGVQNAGICGIYHQTCQVYAISSDFSGAGGEGVRCQQASGATYQSAVLDNCQADPTVTAASSGAALFVSRGSHLHFTLGSCTGSGGVGVEVHRAFLSATDADFSGAAGDGGRFQLGSHVAASGADFSGAGARGVQVTQGSIVSLRGADLTGTTGASLRMNLGGGTVFLSGATTKSGAPGEAVAADLEGISSFNYPTDVGIVHSDTPGPLQNDRFNIQSVGVFSNSGGTNGKQFGNAAVLDSSRDGTSAQTHYQGYNENGLVWSISSDGSGGSFNESSDGALKFKRTPLGEEFDIPALIEALADTAHGYDLRSAKTMEPTGRRGFGLIADLVADVLPDAVIPREGEPGKPGWRPAQLNKTKTIPFLIVGLARLQQRDTAREAELQSLRQRVEALEAE